MHVPVEVISCHFTADKGERTEQQRNLQSTPANSWSHPRLVLKSGIATSWAWVYCHSVRGRWKSSSGSKRIGLSITPNSIEKKLIFTKMWFSVFLFYFEGNHDSSRGFVVFCFSEQSHFTAANAGWMAPDSCSHDIR